MPFRAVLFDIGGVLEEVGDADWLARYVGRVPVPGDRVGEWLGQQIDPEGVVVTGGLSEADQRRQFARALRLSEDEADAFMADLWDWYCGRPVVELLDFARALRPRVRTAILSNSADGARREEERRYRLSEYFDPVVYSHEIGVAKPDTRAYELACEQLRVPPNEVIFLDDVPAFVKGAEQAGLTAVLHTGAAESIATIEALLRDVDA